MEETIISFIYNTVKKYQKKGVVIGISGGIDSAVVAKLCVEALGKEKVFGLLLPERDSSSTTLKDSIEVCDFLDINYKIIKINKILRKMGVYKLQPPALFFSKNFQNKYVKKRWETDCKKDTFLEDLKSQGTQRFLDGLAFYRAKHRVRLSLLYMYAEKLNYFVSGTTNKSEFKTRFYVKWGDDSSDIEPIFHLYKTQVFELAQKLNIPNNIIKKSPSPDLIPGITDEFSMGISYLDLDRILYKIETNKSLESENKKNVNRVKNILEAAKYKDIRNLHIQ